MIMKFIAFLLLFPIAVFSDELPVTECAKWHKENAGVPLISVNGFTKEKAENALQEINSMVADRSGNFNFPYDKYRRSETIIKGYLLAKELLDARKNREHDADEVTSFCVHWASVAYEK